MRQGTTRRKFTKEFKIEAVALSRLPGMTVAKAASDLGVPAVVDRDLGLWMPHRTISENPSGVIESIKMPVHPHGIEGSPPVSASLPAKTNGEPSTNRANGSGREANGRFAKGNFGGPGNPHAAKVASWRRALAETVTLEDIREIVTALVRKAKQGELSAIKELLDRTLGKPLTALDPATAAEQQALEPCQFGSPVSPERQATLNRLRAMAFGREPDTEPKKIEGGCSKQ